MLRISLSLIAALVFLVALYHAYLSGVYFGFLLLGFLLAGLAIILLISDACDRMPDGRKDQPHDSKI